MFSEAFVILLGGACVAGGGVVHGWGNGGHAWMGVCVAGGHGLLMGDMRGLGTLNSCGV